VERFPLYCLVAPQLVWFFCRFEVGVRRSDTYARGLCDARSNLRFPGYFFLHIVDLFEYVVLLLTIHMDERDKMEVDKVKGSERTSPGSFTQFVKHLRYSVSG